MRTALKIHDINNVAVVHSDVTIKDDLSHIIPFSLLGNPLDDDSIDPGTKDLALGLMDLLDNDVYEVGETLVDELDRSVYRNTLTTNLTRIKVNPKILLFERMESATRGGWVDKPKGMLTSDHLTIDVSYDDVTNGLLTHVLKEVKLKLDEEQVGVNLLDMESPIVDQLPVPWRMGSALDEVSFEGVDMDVSMTVYLSLDVQLLSEYVKNNRHIPLNYEMLR